MSGEKRTPTTDRNHAKRPRVDGNHSETGNSNENGYYAGHGLMFTPAEAPNRAKPKTVKELMAPLPRDSTFNKVREQLERMEKNKATRNGLEEAIAIVKDKPAYSEHETRMTRWLKYIIERETTQNECVEHIANALLVEETSAEDNAITPSDIETVKSSDLKQKQKQIICNFLGQMMNRDSKLKYSKVADAITDDVVEAIPDITKRMKAWRKHEDEGLRA